MKRIIEVVFYERALEVDEFYSSSFIKYFVTLKQELDVTVVNHLTGYLKYVANKMYTRDWISGVQSLLVSATLNVQIVGKGSGTKYVYAPQNKDKKGTQLSFNPVILKDQVGIGTKIGT